jgi:hypothetical protein
MAAVTEMGFSVSHEFEGGRASKSIRQTTIKEWLGSSANICPGKGSADGCYGDITVGGKSFSNARIIDESYENEGNQVFRVTTVEEDLSSSCDGCLGFSSEEVENCSETINASKTKGEVSVERAFSISFSDNASCSGGGGVASAPASGGGSGLIDRAISAIKSALQTSVDFTSSDADINSLIGKMGGGCEPNSKIKTDRSEQVDRGSCSVSITERISKSLKDDDCCITDSSVGINIDDNGLVSVTVSGSVKGNCEEYTGCDGSRSISKSKYEFAKECFDDIDTTALLEGEYEKHTQEPCETDLCLAFVKTSESSTHCKVDGTISYSANGAEEEVPEDGGVNSLVTEESTKEGCIVSMTRSFEIDAPVNQAFIEKNPAYLSGTDCSDAEPSDTEEEAIEKARKAFDDIDLDPPADFFGPIGLNFTECKARGTIQGSASYSNDPKYEPQDGGVIKESVTTTNVCTESFTDRKYKIPCSSPVVQKINKKPGYTSVCKDVVAFSCATLKEVLDATEIDVPDGAVIVSQSSSVSVQTGAKSGNRCIKYHTEDDLKECT